MNDKQSIATGDRVRVVARDPLNFGDYENGDTAVVRGVAGDFGVDVEWEHERFKDDPMRERNRCRYLYMREIERIDD